MPYDAVLFDNDGVLTEPTEWDVIRGAIREAFRELGVGEVDSATVDRLIDVTVADVKAVAHDFDLDPEALWRARDRQGSAAQVEYMQNGGKALYDDVAVIAELPAPRGVVSNNQVATVEAIVEHYDLGGLFETIYAREPTLDGVERKKPNPYMLERALADLAIEVEGTDPDRALYVGDKPKDLVAARRVGIDAAFLRREHTMDVELPYEPAFEVADLEELAEALN